MQSSRAQRQQVVKEAPKAGKRKPLTHTGTAGLRLCGKVKILEKSFLFNRKAENVPASGLPVFWLREIPPKPGFDGLGGYCQPERSRGMQGAFHGSAIKRRKSESKVTFERARSRPH